MKKILGFCMIALISFSSCIYALSPKEQVMVDAVVEKLDANIDDGIKTREEYVVIIDKIIRAYPQYAEIFTAIREGISHEEHDDGIDVEYTNEVFNTMANYFEYLSGKSEYDEQKTNEIVDYIQSIVFDKVDPQYRSWLYFEAAISLEYITMDNNLFYTNFSLEKMTSDRDRMITASQYITYMDDYLDYAIEGHREFLGGPEANEVRNDILTFVDDFYGPGCDYFENKFSTSFTDRECDYLNVLLPYQGMEKSVFLEMNSQLVQSDQPSFIKSYLSDNIYEREVYASSTNYMGLIFTDGVADVRTQNISFSEMRDISQKNYDIDNVDTTSDYDNYDSGSDNYGGVCSSHYWIEGPRGGCYYRNSNGNKTYGSHSCCR